MTKIKICGFTDPKEASYISAKDVAFMGMVLFFPKSKRNISIEEAKEIMAAADQNIKKVAVAVSPTLTQVKEIEAAGFDYLQIHGTLKEEVLEETEIPIIRAYNGAGEASEVSLRIAAYLFDAAEPGSGKTFDWAALSQLKRDKPWFLAGGLTAENVGKAIAVVHPDVVDISSGIEYTDRPGKDPKKIVAFIRAVKETGNG